MQSNMNDEGLVTPVPGSGQRFVIERRASASAAGQAESLVYHSVIGRSGRLWLYPTHYHPADMILVTAHPDWHRPGTGFGGGSGFHTVAEVGDDGITRMRPVRGHASDGGMLQLQLDNGSTFVLRGGWHSNAESLFEDTGVDLRDKHLTRVVVGLGRGSDGVAMTIDDVLYSEVIPLVGRFDRGRQLAQQFADELGVRVYYYSESQDGSVCSPVDPEKKEAADE